MWAQFVLLLTLPTGLLAIRPHLMTTWHFGFAFSGFESWLRSLAALAFFANVSYHVQP